MPGRNAVTLRDVAEATGYTINTVSRALKNKPDIGHDTCLTIQRVAREMGYVRNDIASSLRSGRTRTLAMIVGGLSNPFYTILADFVQQEAFRLNYGLMLLCSQDDPEMELNAVEMAISRRADGVLITPLADDTPALARLRESGMPYLLLNRYFEDGSDDCVVSNDEEGGCLAGRYLIGQGHRRLAMLSFFPVAYSARKRYEGFRRACREAGLADPLYAQTSEDDDIRRQLLAWWDEGVTGLFSFCDAEAWKVLSLMRDCGLDMPGDMALVGYDNLQQALSLPLAIPSVDGHLREEAAAAVATIRHRIHHPDLPRQRIILPVSMDP